LRDCGSNPADNAVQISIYFPAASSVEAATTPSRHHVGRYVFREVQWGFATKKNKTMKNFFQKNHNFCS
jgi:hypothetical protein